MIKELRGSPLEVSVASEEEAGEIEDESELEQKVKEPIEVDRIDVMNQKNLLEEQEQKQEMKQIIDFNEKLIEKDK